jgi:hypothetical protein
MLDGFASRVHGLRALVEPALHILEQMLMLPRGAMLLARLQRWLSDQLWHALVQYRSTTSPFPSVVKRDARPLSDRAAVDIVEPRSAPATMIKLVLA